MQHPFLVRCRQTGAELLGDLDAFVFGQPPDAPQQSPQIFAVDIFHREEVTAADLADVVDAADVGMGDLAGDADLAEEPLEASGVVLEVGRQELEGDGLAELQVVRAVDLAHAPLAALLDDPVAIPDDLAGREAAVIGGRAGCHAGGGGGRASRGTRAGGALRRTGRACGPGVRPP